MAKKRGNNEGSISRRTDGRWMAQVTIGRDPQTGRLQRATFYGKTRQEAAEKLTKALADLGHGTFVAPHRLTLGAWLDTWLWDYKKPTLRPSTFDTYEMLVRRHLTPALGALVLRELRPEHVQHYYNTKRSHGLEPQTIRLHHVILSDAFTRAEKHHLVARNVCRLVDPPRASRPERRTLTLQDMTTHLLPALTGHRLAAAFLLLFLMGIRRGELLGLRWQDVDLSAGVVHIRQAISRVKNHATGRTQLIFQEPKTAASRRTIPLPEACLTALRSHRAHQAEEKLLLGPAYTDHGLVFCRPDGAPIDPRTLNGAFN